MTVIIFIAFIVLLIASYWKIFEKADQPGWAAIIPIYNTYILLKIVGKPGWWLILFFIPILNVVIYIWVMNLLAKSFGKNELFTLGLVLPLLVGELFTIGLSFIGLSFGRELSFISVISLILHMVLGFGPAEYIGAAGGGNEPVQPDILDQMEDLNEHKENN